ncbi:MAG: KpsF/GutQ family sugar-phosphate isomerase [Akkermansia muciniphila]|nr:KpsF/GutQ family sugar-phosphate isomerase [Akkermansia muciniphila]
MTDHTIRGKKVFEDEIAALQAIAARLDDSFVQAVEALRAAIDSGHKIIIVGVGKSGLVGDKIAATLTSTGAPAIVLDSMNALHGDLGIVQDGDACIAMSFSGETAELLTLMPFLKRYDMTIIGMTGKTGSTLAQLSDVVLDTGVEREACPLNLAPTSSSTAMLVMGDALAMALLEARHFTKEDFARSHPGGSLGRALLTRICDIMRKEFAKLPESATVAECIIAMTSARAGACVLVHEDGTLAGVFTHGDFARAYQKNPACGSQPVAELMTRNPVYVEADKLAITAVKTLRDRRIDDLVVLDAQKQPVGLIDTQDLVRLKFI